MKILVLPRPIAGVQRESLEQHAVEEIRAVWDLYAHGICRELYTRADELGRVVLLLECASVEAARDALATLPFAGHRLGVQRSQRRDGWRITQYSEL